MQKKTFEGIMLVCDMDGTLLNSRSELSSENIEALKHFVDNGGLFTVATGRMDFAVRRYLRDLPVNAPAILYNGAVIYDFEAGKVLWSKCLEEDVEEVINELEDKFPGLGIEIFSGGDVYFLQQNEETEKHSRREGFTPRLEASGIVPKPWYKVILAGKPESLSQVEWFVDRKELSYRSVYSEPQFLEILDRQVSKGHALSVLTGLLGISLKNVIAMGDNLNDRELLEVAGVGFAVDNSHAFLKEIADYRCCHHDEHAVAEVVGWIEKNFVKHTR